MAHIKKLETYKWLSVIPCICVMAVIFYFSAQSAVESSGLSGGITERVFQLVERLFFLNLDGNDEVFYLNIFETLVRKVAHMAEYAILSITLAYAFFVYENNGWKLIIRCEIICVLYAVTDEIHQLFVPGRSGQIIDVLIDGIGSFFGCMIFAWFVNFIVKKREYKIVKQNLKRIMGKPFIK